MKCRKKNINKNDENDDENEAVGLFSRHENRTSIS